MMLITLFVTFIYNSYTQNKYFIYVSPLKHLIVDTTEFKVFTFYLFCIEYACVVVMRTFFDFRFCRPICRVRDIKLFLYI